MRATLLALTAVALLAAPAAAQVRDPFKPAIAPPGTTAGTATDTTTTTDAAPIQPAPRSETLSNTGADVQGWVVVAFAIISMGAGALYLYKLYAQPL